MNAELPYLDTHTISVALGPDPLWISVHRYASKVGFSEGGVLARLWRTEPSRGFAITDQAPGEFLTLAGKHRFSTYQLTFTVERRTAGRTTLLHATSRAEFPGVHGRLYQALVVGTGLHRIATRRMLRTIAAAARG